jgi:luciferase-like monooxygenase
VDRAEKRIVKEVSSWQGVTASAHSFGGTEFRLGRRELGHVHGDRWADIVFPMEVRDRLVAEGRAEPHHVLPRSGWVTFRFREEGDVERAIELFRLSYEAAEKSLPKPSRGTRVGEGPAALSESSEGS